MTAYATRADLELYAPTLDLTGLDNDAQDALLERASRDLDTVFGPVPVITDETSDYVGWRLDPSRLQPWEALALSRATCAQAEHLRRIDIARAGREAAYASGAPGPVIREKGPDTEVQYAGATGDRTIATDYADETREFGPAVKRELGPIGHLRRLTARARP